MASSRASVGGALGFAIGRGGRALIGRLHLPASGLRGAVPIVLATIPVMAGVDPSRDLFDLVFFVAVLGAILPGAAVPHITRLLGLEARERPQQEP